LAPQQLEAVRKAFRTHDHDGSGKIEINELGFVLVLHCSYSLGGALRAFGIHLPDNAIATVMRKLDLDQDGSVSFDEYCEFVGPYVASAAVYN